jgi:hypothetical protein
MRKAPWLLAAIVLLAAASTLATAESPTLLIRAERLGSEDLERLLREGIPVIHESTQSLLVEGDHQDLAWLREHGYRAAELDENPWAWDYLQIGLRPDTRLDLLREHGRVVYEEANWILLRVPRDHRDAELYRAGGFVAVLPHEPLDLPLSPAGLPGASPDAQTGTDGPDPLIQKIVDGVDTARIDTYWSDLVENPPSGTRFSTSSGCEDAAEYCRSEMLSAGVDAEFQSYSGNHAPNVVGERTGALTPEQVYIVIGHLDDMPMWGPAPGANDNASGSVTVLEAARSMSCYAFESTVKYITCTGEELGLLGSDAYAADAKARGEDIRGVLNFDMNGWEGNGLPSQENLDLSYNAASEDLALLFEQAAADYQTGLEVNAFPCPDMTASDHYSFWKRGYDAVCGITDNEGYCGHEGHYPYYHTSSDTIANCGDPAFFYSTVRAAVATLAELAEPFRITFAEDSTVVGEPIGLLVGDRDLDLDPSAVESMEVEVWSDTEPNPELVPLTEREQSAMIFEGEVPTTGDPPVEGDGVVSVVEGDTLSARYVDALDCDGSSDVAYTDEAGVEGVSIPGEVHGLTVTKQEASTRLSWEEANDASHYDVAGGGLADLRDDGNCSAATCLENDHPDSTWNDTRDDPGPSAGQYYLVRGQNGQGAGGYGARTDGAERQPEACP